MSTTWYRVTWSGACLGWAAYHNTSDLWRPGIVSAMAAEAGLNAFGIDRVCTEPLHPLRWVDLISWDERPTRMLACLECHAFELRPWNEDDWYGDYTAETLARVKPCAAERQRDLLQRIVTQAKDPCHESGYCEFDEFIESGLIDQAVKLLEES